MKRYSLSRHPDGSYQVRVNKSVVGGVASSSDGWYYVDTDGHHSGIAPTRATAAEALIHQINADLVN